MRSLAAARIGHVWRRWLPTILALALATAAPLLAAALSRVTSAQAMTRQLAVLPAADRSVTVAHEGPLDASAGASGYASTDARISSALTALTGSTAVRRQLLYREAAGAAGTSFVLAGTDDLASAVTIDSGRLPTSCTPRRCEVVQLTGPAENTVPAAGDQPGLGLVVVGRAHRRDPLLLGGPFAPGARAQVLIGDGVQEVSALSALSGFGRSQGWVAPLDPERLRRIGVPAFLDASASMGQQLYRDLSFISVTAPDVTLREADQRASASSSRFVVLGSSMALLLLVSAVLGGVAVRADHLGLLELLRRRGASRRVRRGITLAEAGWVAGTGLIVGLVLGVAGSAVLGAVVGLPVAGTAHAAAASGAVLAGLLAVAAGGLITAALAGRVSRVALFALGCCGCAAVVALLVRGGAEGAADPLPAVLPALILLTLALFAAWSWPVLATWLAGRLPRRAVAARLGVSAVAGRPARPAVAVATLAAALAAVTFAVGYRTTLDRGAHDEAAYRVPLPARVLALPGGTSPVDALPTAGQAAGHESVWSAQSLGGQWFPVVRGPASAPVAGGPGGIAESVQVVGVAPSALPLIGHWTAVTGSATAPTDLAARLAVDVPAGTQLPAGRRLHIDLTAPSALVANAYLVDDLGRHRTVALRVADGGWDGDLPDATTRYRLIAITLGETSEAETLRQHNLGEGNRDRPAAAGVLQLGAVTIDSRSVRTPWHGWGSVIPAGTQGPVPDGASWRAEYSLSLGLTVLTGRSGGPGDSAAKALPVLADPVTADQAHGGVFTLTLDSGPLTVRPIAVAQRFPTTSGRFVVADAGAVARLLDLRTPGTGSPGEIWALDAAAAARLTGVQVLDRDQVATSLLTDPVARAGSLTLAVAAGAMAALAALALIVLLAGERLEDADRSYAWEADGVAPRTLRAAMLWRAIPVVLAGAVTGVPIGMVLTVLTARVLPLGARGVDAEPPLLAGVGVSALLGWAVVGVLAAASVYAALAALASARTSREPLPVRGEEL